MSTAPQNAISPTTARALGQWPQTRPPVRRGLRPDCAGLGWPAANTPAGRVRGAGPAFGAEGRAEVRLCDSDGNGLADRAITSGENGVTGYVDTDGDGRWDVKLTDTDGDGAADAASALAPKP